MGIRTGKELLESLGDGREVWLDGERITDLVGDQRLSGAAHTMAELYDMQHQSDLIDKMTFTSPSTGDRVGMSYIEPKSVDDLKRRREMVRVWMEATCGFFWSVTRFYEYSYHRFCQRS